MFDYTLLPELLLPWFAGHKRDLPWRADREPYHVWLSEIMLQQTRVEAVKNYYIRFLQELPDISSLARCEDDRLHKLWEGLGYYSRVRNLKKAAQTVCEQYDGIFPKNYAAVRALCGIGDYTAGAICSICYDMPTPAVDGNVLRVLSRISGDQTPIDTQSAKTGTAEILRKIYPSGRCGDFTQALMELGAIVCVPNGEPHCVSCPLAADCKCKADGSWQAIPAKSHKTVRRAEDKTVFILLCDGKFAIRKRKKSGLLADLWEYPNVPGTLTAEQAVSTVEEWGCNPFELDKAVGKRHIFTHIEWAMQGYYIRCRELSPRFTWASAQELDEVYSLPTAFRQFRE